MNIYKIEDEDACHYMAAPNPEEAKCIYMEHENLPEQSWELVPELVDPKEWEGIDVYPRRGVRWCPCLLTVFNHGERKAQYLGREW